MRDLCDLCILPLMSGPVPELGLANRRQIAAVQSQLPWNRGSEAWPKALEGAFCFCTLDGVTCDRLGAPRVDTARPPARLHGSPCRVDSRSPPTPWGCVRSRAARRAGALRGSARRRRRSAAARTGATPRTRLRAPHHRTVRLCLGLTAPAIGTSTRMLGACKWPAGPSPALSGSPSTSPSASAAWRTGTAPPTVRARQQSGLAMARRRQCHPWMPITQDGS